MPNGKKVPIIVSCPHSGIELPDDIRSRINPELARDLPDTDWYVDKLYDGVLDLGITLMSATYSRYVIDLNRDPKGASLYKDGRQETALVPTRSFAGVSLYQAGDEPTSDDIAQRVQRYYRPYHEMLRENIAELHRQFAHVLLFEAHSIKRLVPTIRQHPFPDLILGDQQGKTADKSLAEAALAALHAGKAYQVAYNDPFMGGYITRHFAAPQHGIHTLQLECSQDIYMDEFTGEIAAIKWGKLRVELMAMFEGLISALGAL